MTKVEYFILLNMIDGIGPVKARLLLDHFMDIEQVFKANKSALMQVKDINGKLADALINAGKTVDLDKELKSLERHKARVITLEDEEYPELLKQIYAPPVLLYIKGALCKEDNFSVGIVGARRCTHYGLEAARKISAELAEQNVTVVSGLARGIDSAAHKSALAKGGRTIAVLGNGLASVYPPENKELAADIEKHGAVISEFSMQAKPYKENFPRRNRIISGLSLGIVVVEASRNSGALITASYATEQNREVFAVPGNITNPNSYGPNSLIKDGAKLAESAGDVIDELRIDTSSHKKSCAGKAVEFSGDDKKLYEALSCEPQDVEEITQKLNLPVHSVSNLLFKLELSGIVKQLPGKRFALKG